MEQANMSSLEMQTGYTNRIILRPETAMRMLGVLLFYAILFVAASEFTN